MNAVAALAPHTIKEAAPSLLRRAVQGARAVAARLGWTARPALDLPSRNFVRFCRQRWPWRTDSSAPLVLMHQVLWYPSVLCYAFMSQALARRHGAGLASFGTARTGRPLDTLFRSFGAPNILGPRQLRRHARTAGKIAGDLLAACQTRRDVANLSFEGVALGDLVYDSHLRYHATHTVEVDDPRLRVTVADAMQRFLAARALLESREIALLLVDHAVYMDAGILARLAIQRGLPVYHLPYKPATLLRLEQQDFAHHVAGPGSAEAGRRTCKLPLPYQRFSQIFASFPAEEQVERRARGRGHLENRLSGKFDFRVLAGGSAYHAGSRGRVLAETSRPRVVVMLHDFCDAPHAYRDLIFEDHYQWTCWLFERAARSGCDCYAKEHPNSAHDPVKAAVNRRILSELKERFPHIRFLPPEVSNRQLIEEGVAAVFTGYGTVGHEFAFVGVPVVNAGDNPHINYAFNFHPQTVEELATLVDGAGELALRIDPAEVEEYAYLRYEYFFDRSFHTVDIVPPELEQNPAAFREVNTSAVLRYAAQEPARREAQIEEYLDRLYRSGRHLLPA